MSTTSYKDKIAARAAREISEGKVVNFGIGIPTLIAKFLPPEVQFFVHAENGVLGMGGRCPRGQEDRNLIDAGGAYVELVPGASFSDSSVSFAMIRGGRLDVAFFGGPGGERQGRPGQLDHPRQVRARHRRGHGGGPEGAASGGGHQPQ